MSYFSTPPEKGNAINTASLGAYQPVFVTVVMPIRNEAEFIERSLGAVLTQDYPHDLLEVLIANGMSTDDTRQIIARVAASHSCIRVVTIDNPHRIVSTGLNLALSQARGDVIVRVDGRLFIEPDYIRQCVTALQRSGADHVGGRVETLSRGCFGRAVSLATSSRFGVGHGRFRYSEHEEWPDTVAMGAWPREVFERIGLFDEEQVRNQDDEFNYRLRDCGGTILLNPHIRSSYLVRSAPGALWRQYYQYGYWKVRVMQKHPSQMRLRQFVPPIFVAVLLLMLGLAPFTVAGRWGLALVAGSYVAAKLIVSVRTAKHADWRLVPLLMIAFAILHLSYGLGFLVGLAKFWNRWNDKGRWSTLGCRHLPDLDRESAS